MKRNTFSRLALSTALIAAASSCASSRSETRSTEGTSSSSPSPSPAPAESSPAPATTASASPAPIELPAMPTGLHGPARPWGQMSARERGRYMDEAIVPAMGQLLHAYDAQHFAETQCATCHGANAHDVHFRMPNSLPALPAFGTEASQHMMAENPRIFQFMAERVVPAMSQLLGVPAYNPQTHQGFGCFNCHPHAS